MHFKVLTILACIFICRGALALDQPDRSSDPIVGKWKAKSTDDEFLTKVLNGIPKSETLTEKDKNKLKAEYLNYVENTVYDFGPSGKYLKYAIDAEIALSFHRQLHLLSGYDVPPPTPKIGRKPLPLNTGEWTRHNDKYALEVYPLSTQELVEAYELKINGDEILLFYKGKEMKRLVRIREK